MFEHFTCIFHDAVHSKEQESGQVDSEKLSLFSFHDLSSAVQTQLVGTCFLFKYSLNPGQLFFLSEVAKCSQKPSPTHQRVKVLTEVEQCAENFFRIFPPEDDNVGNVLQKLSGPLSMVEKLLFALSLRI